MATGHHKFQPKTQFLCSGFKRIRKAKPLWGEEFVFLCLTEKPRKSVPYIKMPMFKKGYLRTSWILGAEAVSY